MFCIAFVLQFFFFCLFGFGASLLPIVYFTSICTFLLLQLQPLGFSFSLFFASLHCHFCSLVAALHFSGLHHACFTFFSLHLSRVIFSLEPVDAIFLLSLLFLYIARPLNKVQTFHVLMPSNFVLSCFIAAAAFPPVRVYFISLLYIRGIKINFVLFFQIY